ncbi:MAG: AAA family ATPase [Synergistaceae bacterium]|nr:AAA family ATPase [Synergistaceae bacterium]
MQVLKAKDLKEERVTALFYGPPGIGKTTLLGMLPGKTLIVDVDRGTSVLKGNENVDIVRLSEDLKDLPTLLKELGSKCAYDNVCIDSLSELERGMLAFFGRVGSNDGVPTLQDYGRVNYKLVDYCRQYRALDANIVFTAWEDRRDIVAPTGEKFTQICPLLRDKVVDNVCGLCDIVGQIVVTKEGERVVRLEGSQGLVAKDRLRKRKVLRGGEAL